MRQWVSDPSQRRGGIGTRRPGGPSVTGKRWLSALCRPYKSLIGLHGDSLWRQQVCDGLKEGNGQAIVVKRERCGGARVRHSCETVFVAWEIYRVACEQLGEDELYEELHASSRAKKRIKEGSRIGSVHTLASIF